MTLKSLICAIGAAKSLVEVQELLRRSHYPEIAAEIDDQGPIPMREAKQWAIKALVEETS